jgi:dTDP-4-amino-4,6-dideoxy-D-galactose acyltransferase
MIMTHNLVPLRGDEDRIRSALAANLPWSPVDFVRSVSPEGDRALTAEQLTHPVAEANDLRFLYRDHDGAELAVLAEKLAWDSEFFGYGIGKISGVYPLSAPFHRPHGDFTDGLREVVREARDRDIVYLFAQVDPRDLATLRALGNLGFSLIETRAFYHMSLKDYSYEERYAVRAASRDDVESLGKASRESVNLYDRFHADPFVRPEDADRLMYKWVEASVLERFADVTIVPDVPNPGAFCTVKYHKDKWATWGVNLAQPVFSAVSPEFRGWYKKIISEINYHLLDLGAEHSYLCTQVTNKAVIYVWESLGYRFGRSEHVLRLIL